MITQLLSDIDLTTVYSKLAEGRKKYVKPYVLSDEQYVEKWMGVQRVRLNLTRSEKNLSNLSSKTKYVFQIMKACIIMIKVINVRQ